MKWTNPEFIMRTQDRKRWGLREISPLFSGMEIYTPVLSLHRIVHLSSTFCTVWGRRWVAGFLPIQMNPSQWERPQSSFNGKVEKRNSPNKLIRIQRTVSGKCPHFFIFHPFTCSIFCISGRSKANFTCLHLVDSQYPHQASSGLK